MSSTREMSVTHISVMASADRMRTRVASAKIEKNPTSPSRISPSGTYSSTSDCVRLSKSSVSSILPSFPR